MKQPIITTSPEILGRTPVFAGTRVPVQTLFDYLENGAPLAYMDAGGYLTGVTVISPSVLIDDVELDVPREERPKLPIVPPPAP